MPSKYLCFHCHSVALLTHAFDIHTHTHTHPPHTHTHTHAHTHTRTHTRTMQVDCTPLDLALENGWEEVAAVLLDVS